MKASINSEWKQVWYKELFCTNFSRSSKMFKSNLGLGTKLGAAANKSDLNVSLIFSWKYHVISLHFYFTYVFENHFCNNTCHQKAWIVWTFPCQCVLCYCHSGLFSLILSKNYEYFLPFKFMKLISNLIKNIL